MRAGAIPSAEKLFGLLSIQAYVRAHLYPQVSGADFILRIEWGGASSMHSHDVPPRLSRSGYFLIGARLSNT